MLKIGDVAKIDFKWPQDENSADGLKSRACTVFAAKADDDGATSALFVVPQHGLPPGEKPKGVAAKYAFKLTRMQQSQLGLLKKDKAGVPVPGQKESWVIPHVVNLVEVPQNPAIARVRSADGTLGWSVGRMPEGIMSRILAAQKAARAAGDLRILPIRREQTDRSLSRTAPPADAETSKRDAMAERISQRAAEMAQRKARKPTLSINSDQSLR